MTDATVRDPRPATAPDNAAISVTEMGTRRIVDLKQKGLFRALLPVAVAGLCVGVALIVAQQLAGRFPGRPEYALVALSAFSPWKRAWMGGVLITFGDATVRVGGWLFDEDAEELRALIEEMRPPPPSVDDDAATETPADRKIRVVEHLDEA